MKRLIRNRRFKQFLTPSGTWTRDPKQAQVFPTDEEARKAREEFPLEDAELYYLVGEEPSMSDFALGLERI
jgi:hypothetical protein